VSVDKLGVKSVISVCLREFGSRAFGDLYRVSDLYN
jgi:hypothetical protein